MNPFARIPTLAMVLALAACAGQNTRTPIADEAAGEAAMSAEAAADAPHANGSPLDPWEGFNRKVYAFNNVLDRALLRPVAKGYATVTPRVVRKGVSNFFGNLQQPVSALNLLLQGHPGQAGTALGRFLMNATLGLGGVLDPATEAGIPLRQRDFGQTFAQWGWQDSRYLVLPIFGPGTVRDGFGKGVNTTVSPISWLARREGAEVSILYGVDARASVLPFESFMQDAADPYLLVRDAYLQRRRCQVMDCSEEMPDYLLPDYEFEVPDFDTLRR